MRWLKRALEWWRSRPIDDPFENAWGVIPGETFTARLSLDDQPVTVRKGVRPAKPTSRPGVPPPTPPPGRPAATGKYCWDCRYIRVDVLLGAGEMQIECDKRHWTTDDLETPNALRRAMSSAHDCPDYESR